MDFYSRQHRMPRPDMSPGAMEQLLTHRWPGNIRELKNVIERVVLKVNGHTVRAVDLPPDVFGAARPARLPADSAAETVTTSSQVDELAARMLKQGESFWSVVYPLFMSRDLTRADLRKIIKIGLESTNGNYRLLTQLFNMGDDDYKKFLNFLRKYDCHLPFQLFRIAQAAVHRQTQTRAGRQPPRICNTVG
jgi:DNA-binding NtrC family response regulator